MALACPYAQRGGAGQSVRCTALREKNLKWDFCVHQYYCRQSGQYELSKDAACCKHAQEKKE